jgi:hypothetical protein
MHTFAVLMLLTIPTVDDFVRDLGHDDFRRRERASNALRQVHNSKAIEHLKAERDATKDLEVKHRLCVILDEYRVRAEPEWKWMNNRYLPSCP